MLHPGWEINPTIEFKQFQIFVNCQNISNTAILNIYTIPGYLPVLCAIHVARNQTINMGVLLIYDQESRLIQIALLRIRLGLY